MKYDLIIDGKVIHCQSFDTAIEITEEPEMVEVTITCTMDKKDYERMLKENGGTTNEIRKSSIIR